jgi:hypothetical protein
MGGPMRRTLCLLAVAASTSVSSLAYAQQPSNHEEAVRLFQEGKELRDKNRCDLAISKLEQSIGKEESIGARYNLGVCYEKSNRKLALENYRKAEDLAEKKGDDRLREIRAQREDFLAKNPPLRLALPQPLPADLHVTVDNDPIPTEDLQGETLYFPKDDTKSAYEVHVSAPGYEDFRLSVDKGNLKKKTLVTVVLKKQSDGTVAQPQPRAAETKWGPFQYLGLGLIAVGAAALTYASVAFILYRADESNLRDKFIAADAAATDCKQSAAVCARNVETRENLREEYNDNEKEAENNGGLWLTFAIGGGLAIGGGILLIVAGPRTEVTDPGATAKTEPKPTFRFVPAIGARQQGLSLVGTF